MSNSANGGSVWAELSEAQKIESVSAGRATLKEMVAGLLDGSDKLRAACRDFLANSDVCLEQTRIEEASKSASTTSPEPKLEQQSERSEDSLAGEANGVLMDGARKRRQGLPEGYVPRQHKH
jgi:hypothetical protein